MQAPKHIREAKAKALQATVSRNLEAKAIAKANGIPLTSKGYRMTPDLRNGYVFTNPSNLGSHIS